MSIPIFPVYAIQRPYSMRQEIQAVVNSFGYPFEQRVVTSLPYGPRDDGLGVSTYVLGRRVFPIGIPHLPFEADPYPLNEHLENSLEALWQFYLDRFYDHTNRQVKYEPFYWYDPLINGDKSTWTGINASSGSWRGTTVYNTTGRFLVRFSTPNLTRVWFNYCLVSFDLELVEVAS